MSYFSFENEVSDLLRLDAPISKGPAPRWQRKSMDARSGSTTSTPLKNTSHLNKTPSKTPKSIAKKTPKTPSEDRFIPNRASMNFELNYYKMVSNDENEVEGVSPSKAEFKKNVSENLCGNDLKARILSYKNKAPTPREGSIVSVSVICENYYNEKDKRIYISTASLEVTNSDYFPIKCFCRKLTENCRLFAFHFFPSAGYMNDLRVLYSQNRTPSTTKKKNTRHIPQAPSRILDAPDLIDDYCMYNSRQRDRYRTDGRTDRKTDRSTDSCYRQKDR